MPRGVLGMNSSMFKGYLRYFANRRATQIGLETLFPNEENPFPWMSEMIDLKKRENFLRLVSLSTNLAGHYLGIDFKIDSKIFTND